MPENTILLYLDGTVGSNKWREHFLAALAKKSIKVTGIYDPTKFADKDANIVARAAASTVLIHVGATRTTGMNTLDLDAFMNAAGDDVPEPDQDRSDHRCRRNRHRAQPPDADREASSCEDVPERDDPRFVPRRSRLLHPQVHLLALSVFIRFHHRSFVVVFLLIILTNCRLFTRIPIVH